MSKLFTLRISNDFSSELLDTFLPFLTEYQRQTIQRQSNGREIQVLFYADILLRTVLCHYLNINNIDLILRRSLSGTPFVVTAESVFIDLAFNDEWILCCLSQSPVTGIVQKNDISMEPRLKYELTEEEIKYISVKNTGQANKILAQFCAIKNCLLKLVAGNKSYRYQQIPLPLQKNGVLDLDQNSMDRVYYRFYEADFQNLMVLTQTLDGFDNDFYTFSQKELLDRFQQVL